MRPQNGLWLVMLGTALLLAGCGGRTHNINQLPSFLPTDTPEVTATPEATATPEVSATSEATAIPEATATPDPALVAQAAALSSVGAQIAAVGGVTGGEWDTAANSYDTPGTWLCFATSAGGDAAGAQATIVGTDQAFVGSMCGTLEATPSWSDVNEIDSSTLTDCYVTGDGGQITMRISTNWELQGNSLCDGLLNGAGLPGEPPWVS